MPAADGWRSADLAEIANFLGITPSVDTEAIQVRGMQLFVLRGLHLLSIRFCYTQMADLWCVRIANSDSTCVIFCGIAGQRQLRRAGGAPPSNC